MIALEGTLSEVQHHWRRVCRSAGTLDSHGGAEFFVEHHADLLPAQAGDRWRIDIAPGTEPREEGALAPALGTDPARYSYIMNGQVAQLREEDVVVSAGGLLVRLPRSLPLALHQSLQLAIGRLAAQTPAADAEGSRRRPGSATRRPRSAAPPGRRAGTAR